MRGLVTESQHGVLNYTRVRTSFTSGGDDVVDYNPNVFFHFGSISRFTHSFTYTHTHALSLSLSPSLSLSFSLVLFMRFSLRSLSDYPIL